MKEIIGLDNNQILDSRYIEHNKEYLNDVIEGLRGEVLWTNDNPSNNFNPQTISLDGTNYDYYKIIYKITTARENFKTTEFKKGWGSILEVVDIPNVLAACTRLVNSSSNTEISFAGCRRTSDANTVNNCLIPMYVIGYETKLF